MRVNNLEPVFVDHTPGVLEPGTVYISMPFRTSVHLCCCGCGIEVWLPIRPDRYAVTYDGERVSFSPSVGNWRFPCRSHYWIRANRVVWHTDAGDSNVEAQPPWWRSLLNRLRRNRFAGRSAR